MIDVVYFVLAALPLVCGLALVLLAIKERAQASTATMKGSHRHTSR
jgi:hypothetical protein